MSEDKSCLEEQSSTRIKKWIIEILSNQNYDTAEVDIVGSSEKGEGYMGDVTFAKVSYSKNKINGVLDIVAKSGKLSKSLRENMPVQMAFERELVMYNTIVPLFQDLEVQYQLDYLRKFLPKCYGTLLREDVEVVLLQNLKSIGYELHDRFQPLNIHHLKLTFKNYGKFHGFGLAYKYKYPVEFQDKFRNLPCFLKITINNFSNMLISSEKTLYSELQKAGEIDLVQRLKNKLPNGFLQKYIEMLDVREENSTLIHGDCWNNNYMFKYQGLERAKPEAVAFLDFQVTKVAPPIFDLAHHIYSTASSAELEQFDILLQTYHQSLANCLKELKCDPEEIFPFSELQRQWKAYAAFGFLIGTAILPFILTNKEDTVDIQEMTQVETIERLSQLEGENHNRFASRLLAATKHFLNST